MNTRPSENSPGATYFGGGRCYFRVWAPNTGTVDLHLSIPAERLMPLMPVGDGYFEAVIDGVEPGARYFYRLDGRVERPDPASRSQPDGVHEPSAVVDPAFSWNDGDWHGRPLEDYIIYELHVGLFSEEGTFEGVITRLPYLVELGITAVELMPVAQFPGSRNWGYDGVYPFAVQDSYGGATGLKNLVDACHRAGLAVILDVVYNHFGPEGNYCRDFGPYFSKEYRTPWGEAINFDGPGSDGVRGFFIENAVQWFQEFHIDALRLDAVHAILDNSAYPFLEELRDRVRRLGESLGRELYLIAESDRNDSRLAMSPECGGQGLSGLWNDDFHHALQVLLTGERDGYYLDFQGLPDLAQALSGGFVFTGQYSEYRRRRHGRPSEKLSGRQMVVFSQNHDQIGNRMLGQRLSSLVPFEALKLAAAVVLLSPYVPLLFMGEEYGETALFLYFISHGDPSLVEAIREGRRLEFSGFRWKEQPPDPQSEETYRRCKLSLDPASSPGGPALLAFYRELIRLRRSFGAQRMFNRNGMSVEFNEQDQWLTIGRGDGEMVAVFNFGDDQQRLSLPAGVYRKLLDSADSRWSGPGAVVPAEIDSAYAVVPPKSVILLLREAADVGV